MMDVPSLYRQAAYRVARQWTQGEFDTGDGEGVCLVGGVLKEIAKATGQRMTRGPHGPTSQYALGRLLSTREVQLVLSFLVQCLKETGRDSHDISALYVWNDEATRTKEDVIAFLFDAATQWETYVTPMIALAVTATEDTLVAV